MVKRKTESMPSGSFYERHKRKISVVLSFVIAAAFLYSSWNVATNYFVQKNVVNDQICQIVGLDQDAGVLAMRCMIK